VIGAGGISECSSGQIFRPLDGSVIQGLVGKVSVSGVNGSSINEVRLEVRQQGFHHGKGLLAAEGGCFGESLLVVSIASPSQLHTGRLLYAFVTVTPTIPIFISIGLRGVPVVKRQKPSAR